MFNRKVVQVIFSLVNENTIKILSKRETEGIDSVLLFDDWHFDEARREIEERTIEEVLKVIGSLKLKCDLTHLDTTQLL